MPSDKYAQKPKPKPGQHVDVCADTVTGDIVVKICDYKKYSQACQQYSTVIRHVDNNAETPVCPATTPSRYRRIVNQYVQQHTSKWDWWVSPAPPNQLADIKSSTDDVCERDEYPPHWFKHSQTICSEIRRVPRWQNAGQADL